MKTQNRFRQLRTGARTRYVVTFRAIRSPGLAILVILWALALLSGCGGGGKKTNGKSIDDQLFTPNYVSSLNGSLYHWNRLPIRVSFNIPSDWQGTEWDNLTAYSTAATAWNQPGKQEFVTVVPYGMTAEVVVYFVTRAFFSGKPHTMGETQVVYDTTGLLHSAVIRVTRENPYGGFCSLSRLQVTIAHEVGHALGILGHSPYEDDLMYSTKPEGASYLPTVRDLNTAMTAYPSYFARTLRALEAQRQVPSGPLQTKTID